MEMRRDWVGVFVTMLSILSLLLLLVYAHNQRTITECQARVNAVYLETIKERGVLADKYFDNVDYLIVGVFSSKSKQESRKVFENYQRARDEYLIERESAQYPSDEQVC